MIVFCLSDVCFCFRLHAITKADSLFLTRFDNHSLLSGPKVNRHVAAGKDLNVEELLEFVAPTRVVLVVDVELIVAQVVKAN